MQYHFACVWDSFLKLRNVWTTPSVWFYILYSHIYFLFIAFYCIAYTQSALNWEYTLVVLFHFYSFYFSVCMSAICMYSILYCFVWRAASLWTQKQVKSNKPVSAICFMFGHFFDVWLNQFDAFGPQLVDNCLICNSRSSQELLFIQNCYI